MSILAIGRYFVGDPNIVAIVCDDSLAAITTAGYLTGTDIAGDIDTLQNGEFQWTVTDIVLIKYSVSIGYFTHDAINNTFIALAAPGGLSPTLSSGQMFVGSVANVATGVAPSGDIATISNAGAFTIANAAITLAKLAPGVAPAGVIKYMGQVTTVGGAAAEAFVVTGAVAATDRAFVQVVNDGPNNVQDIQAVVTANTLTITFSADPGAGAVVNYQLIRAAS